MYDLCIMICGLFILNYYSATLYSMNAEMGVGWINDGEIYDFYSKNDVHAAYHIIMERERNPHWTYVPPVDSGIG